MNWLAHLFLSEPDVEARIGQVAADWVKGDARLSFALRIQYGFARHREIDNFTDAHPIALRSIARIEPPFKRYAAVLIDVFYDHFLACDWRVFSSEQTLAEFTAEVYAQFAAYDGELHPDVRRGLSRMAEDDWLGSYATTEGIDLTLKRISRRLRRANILGEALPQLIDHYADLREDFHLFFPLLRAHVRRLS
jgi:acyl carrier protein phosphodiesterase